MPHIELTTSALPQAVVGTLIADSSGGTRTNKKNYLTHNHTQWILLNPYANTIDVLPEGYTPGVTTWADLRDKIFEIDLGQINVQSIYEGDMVLSTDSESTL